MADRGARQIYYKYCATFDSTDDGNIGPCSDVLMRLRGADRLGFCPAFPGVGITVYQGHMFLRDQLLSESDKRLDPVTCGLAPCRFPKWSESACEKRCARSRRPNVGAPCAR